jgi:hypothetical protein
MEAEILKRQEGIHDTITTITRKKLADVWQLEKTL